MYKFQGGTIMGFAGNWECLSRSSFGDSTTYWYIKEENGVYSGVSEAFGAKTEFTSVKFENNKFTCQLSMNMGGMQMNLTMEGEYDPVSDTITGSSNSSMGVTPFTGKRMPE
ncbi:MAG: hypothetical protein IK026_02670 [Eubacteriaceae bacterium]|nr:hypothetical protein [Eubacteriaceae bacterium]